MTISIDPDAFEAGAKAYWISATGANHTRGDLAWENQAESIKESVRRDLTAFFMAYDSAIPANFDVNRCRQCGCTDDDCSGCVERTGEPCYWVEADLCSACAGVPV